MSGSSYSLRTHKKMKDGACEGAGPADPKLQGLHGTGQQHDIQGVPARTQH